MGMYNNIEVKLALPGLREGFSPEFQTKDLEPNLLDLYRIDADGALYRQAYDIEDQSDPTKPGLLQFVGAMTRVNKRWERTSYTGEVRFYDNDTDTNTWYEYSTYFERGQLVRGPHRLDEKGDRHGQPDQPGPHREPPAR